jgi:hypothetical protein
MVSKVQYYKIDVFIVFCSLQYCDIVVFNVFSSVQLCNIVVFVLLLFNTLVYTKATIIT